MWNENSSVAAPQRYCISPVSSVPAPSVSAGSSCALPALSGRGGWRATDCVDTRSSCADVRCCTRCTTMPFCSCSGGGGGVASRTTGTSSDCCSGWAGGLRGGDGDTSTYADNASRDGRRNTAAITAVTKSWARELISLSPSTRSPIGTSSVITCLSLVYVRRSNIVASFYVMSMPGEVKDRTLVI